MRTKWRTSVFITLVGEKETVKIYHRRTLSAVKTRVLYETELRKGKRAAEKEITEKQGQAGS